MKIIDVPFAILRFQYRIARTPLQLVEDRVMARMDPEAPRRLMYERALGALDAAAGSALRDSELEESGITRIQRAAELGEAARLDAMAAQTKREAEDQLAAKREKAATTPQKARQSAQERVVQARQDAEQGKREAAQKAAQKAAAAKQDIAESADQSVAAAEKAKRSAQNRSKAAERAVTDVADEQLDDAAQKRRAATSVRAHADRIEDLKDSEKDKRQADSS